MEVHETECADDCEKYGENLNGKFALTSKPLTMGEQRTTALYSVGMVSH